MNISPPFILQNQAGILYIILAKRRPEREEQKINKCMTYTLEDDVFYLRIV